ncbi:hypothetical protein [Rhizobium phage RHph_X2_28B]|uniref:hypothetical protein n=1 Tax=Rhizobium phage RHph_X2_28B TaxID=2836086 RepID=UPI0023290BEE|nr:hypothetical protein PP751_gp080 [Rhizobium phage RHph_X2_28B]QWY83532.1 hypothetical protein [Rhizobium phage RHph_X2_28B]QWY83768.1 hypothetical protein [Rhizobium phage RHph_X3_15]
MNDKELGQLTEALKNIERQLDEARQGRKQHYDRLESIDRKVDHLDWRVADLEKKLNTMSPTVDEFAHYRTQVQGAGKLGRVIWTGAGYLLTAAGSAVAMYMWVISHVTIK